MKEAIQKRWLFIVVCSVLTILAVTRQLFDSVCQSFDNVCQSFDSYLTVSVSHLTVLPYLQKQLRQGGYEVLGQPGLILQHLFVFL